MPMNLEWRNLEPNFIINFYSPRAYEKSNFFSTSPNNPPHHLTFLGKCNPKKINTREVWCLMSPVRPAHTTCNCDIIGKSDRGNTKSTDTRLIHLNHFVTTLTSNLGTCKQDTVNTQDLMPCNLASPFFQGALSTMLIV